MSSCVEAAGFSEGLCEGSFIVIHEDIFLHSDVKPAAIE